MAISRPGYPEMPPLKAFIAERMPGCIVDYESFASGNWINEIGRWTDIAGRKKFPHKNGLAQLADLVRSWLN